MIQQLPAFKSTSWKKFLFLICIVLGVLFRGNAQNYVDVSLKEIDINGQEQNCPPSNGFTTEIVIAPISGMNGIGIGWGANLYLKSEAGSANTIYDLTWILGSLNTYMGVTYTFDNLDIWMYESSEIQFSSTSRPDVQAWSSGTLPTGVSNLVKVVSNGRFVVKDVGSECIASLSNSLDVPYYYSGNNSLVIYLEKKTKATSTNISGAAFPVYKQNSRGYSTRRLCNWEGTVSIPLPSTAINTSKNKFARVVFNRVKANRQVNRSCDITRFIGDCLPVTCSTTSITPSSTSVCKGGGDITFTKLPTSTVGTYSSTSGLVIDANTGSVNAITSTPGSYTVTFTESASCKFTSSITIKNKPDKPNFSGITQPTCNSLGSVPVLNYLTSPAIYTFNPSNGISIDSNGKISAASGKYIFVVSQDGCSSDSSLLLTMNDVPGKPVLSGADTICMGTNLTLKAWTDNIKTTASTPNATNPWGSSDPTIVTVSNVGLVTSLNKSGKVRITYTDNANCTQFDSIVVAEKAVSGTTSFTVDTICESISKSIVLSGFTPSYTIEWQDSIAGSGAWNDMSNETSATFNTPTSLVPGNYFYRAVVKNTFCSLNDISISKLVKVVVTSKSAPTFTNTDIIQPTCLVATGGVTSKMQYAGVWTIKATADPLSTGVSKDTTGTVNVIPYALSLKGLSPGKYTFQVTNSKGCTSNPSSEIEIKTQPSIPAKPALDADTIYCASNSYTLDKIVFKPKPNLSASESIKYYDKNGVIITNPKLVTVIPNESYTFVFNNGSCDSKDKLTTIIPFDNGPALPSSGGDINLADICAISKPTFNTLFSKLTSIDTSKYTFFISPNPTGTPILLNNATIGFNGGIKQTMYYTLADKKNGCKNNTFAKLEFKLDEGPIGLTLKGTQLFCGFSNPTVAKLDTAIVSKTDPANSLVWYTSDVAVTPLPGNTPLVSGLYYAAEKASSGCESVARKQVLATIENFGPTTLDPNNVYAFCKGSNKKVEDLPIAPYSTVNFVWLDSYKKEIKDKTIALIQGKYYAAEFKNGCISDQSLAIDVKFDSPIISIAPTKLPTCGVGNGALTVVGAQTSYSYQWYKNDLILIDSINYKISGLPFDYTFEYKVIVKDTKGCFSADSTNFSDCEPPGIPHVLTLNKDGKNDVFKLHYDTKYPKCKLSIFNRWGAMVYESKDMPYKDDWDGKPNAAGTLGSGELPTGTYFYLIDKGDGSALESGYIELVK